ncbi:GNAT family N-acetyltransferase [Streptomyces sp. NPDC047813]|uniref:GNAT family N-acetyltransferase n=1 Tax=Streptomyces sp. NPDC047813 TaxID=3154608 RepID=UPI0033E15091
MTTDPTAPTDPPVTSDLTVRPARPADARSLAELRWAFKREDHEAPPDTAPPLDEAERWIGERLGGGQWLAWVAEYGGEIRGHVFLALVERVPEPFADNDSLGYVTNFFVEPAYRNQGAGTALLDALTSYARGARLETLIVWPSERSDPLYRRSGFRPPAELLERPLPTDGGPTS